MEDFIKHRLTLLVAIVFITKLSCSSGSNSSELLLLPMDPTEYRMLEGEGRRRLAPFQMCLLCKCCPSGGDPTNCASMSCCFGIDCQLPNKPFGVCAFVPKTCNCTSCAV